MQGDPCPAPPLPSLLGHRKCEELQNPLRQPQQASSGQVHGSCTHVGPAHMCRQGLHTPGIRISPAASGSPLSDPFLGTATPTIPRHLLARVPPVHDPGQVLKQTAFADQEPSEQGMTKRADAERAVVSQGRGEWDCMGTPL